MTRIVGLRAADRSPQPWKNGGGVTREVAVSPPGSRHDRFDWRVSLADISSPGPFSRFDGIDRVLAVTHGTLRIAIAGDAPILLGERDPPRAFSGIVPVLAEPCGDVPVRDCNLMVRRSFGRGTMRWVAGTSALPPPQTIGAIRLVLAPRGGVLRSESSLIDLEPEDAAILPGSGDVRGEGGPPILFVEIDRFNV